MADYDDQPAGKGGDDALCRKLKNWYRQDISHVGKWRKEAREDFKFYSGDQWSDDDKKALAAKARVPVVFNRVSPLVNAVVGSEINNRREVQYIPREQGDAVANEVLTAAGEWFRDNTGAEDEESDAFEDATIGGMGWTDTRLDFESDPDGAPVIERMDCMEMVWDSNAVKPNLADATRMFRVKEMPFSAAEELFPGKSAEELNATWAKTLGVDDSPHDQDRADKYDGSQSDDESEHKKCIVVEARWLERQVYYRGPNVENPAEMKEYAEEQVKLIRKQMPDFPAVRQTRKVVRRAFIGKDILGEPDQPLVPPGMFGWECITGYRDKMDAQFYGIVRTAKDPQRWTNKFFSQVMFLMNSQAKGGIAAERGAFENDIQAEKSWAQSEEITWMTKGALSGEKPKFIPKPQAQFPAGFFTLFQESKEEVNQVVGLSPEFIGTREVDQAGVLEAQRKQSSLNLLASLFNSLRRYRKRQGQTMLFLIQNHLSDGRLIRIVGDDKKQYVPLTKENVSSSTYDIIVDDAPTSPNEKERIWGILTQMFPLLKDMMTPDIALEMLAYSPLPASMVEKLRKKSAEAAQAPKPPTPEEQKMQLEQQKGQIDMAGKQADLQMKQEENKMDLEMKAIELFLDQQKAQQELEMDRAKMGMDMQRLAMQEQQNAVNRQQANAKQTSATRG